ncbi:hypothetical protein SAMN04489760_10148 [Syntrophus gentianae]|uniref:Uncharacterized protein n=1 Tax=Syntrophus gentianae TaxID=43775 RepID=A0A1H7UA06_9BACT|nr:hypothetical protein [Syntrophus gentianae]SEL93528.1 hypothetical protein SAMN04489760_10148 [Syntrophus gentianae]
MPLIFAPESGEAIIGSERISFVPLGDDGSIRIEGRPGSIIRPLCFGERTRLLIDALQADDPLAFCSDLLVHAATNSPAAALSPGVKVLALMLAGGNIEAPSLSRTVAVVAEATGWPPEIINAKTAIEIDRMAFDLTTLNPGWNRIVFPRQGADDAEAIISELVTDLLNRTDEAMIRLVEEGITQTADPEGRERAIRMREREGQPAPADFPSDQFAGVSRIPAAHPGQSSSRSLTGGNVFPPEPHEKSLSVHSSATPHSVRLSRQSVDSQDFALRRHREPFEERGLPGRTNMESAGGFVGDSREDALSPSAGKIPGRGIFAVEAKDNGPDVQRTDRRGFAPPAAALRTEGVSATGVLDRNPLQRAEFETVPKENGLKPESRGLSRPAPPASGNQTGAGREQEGFPDGNREEKGSYAGLATERFSPSMGSQGILKTPVAGSAPLSFYAETDRDRGKDILSSLDDLDLAALADEIGRLLAAEADLRGID